MSYPSSSTYRRLRVILVPTPTLSGPTSGRVEEEELAEWAWQARRWTIGAAEVFHYFMIKAHRIPFRAALLWGTAFLFYYGVLLCCSHLFGLTMIISRYMYASSSSSTTYPVGSFSNNLTIAPTIPPNVSTTASTNDMLFYLGILGVYTNSLLMFLLDVFAPKLLAPRPEERISALRNVYHFVLSPLVIAAYSLVEFVAITELAFRGKKVCSHKPSKKGELV